MHYRKLGAAVAATVALMLPQAPGFTQEKQVVRTQEYPGNLVHLVDWVMREKGFCARQLLDCQPVTLANGPLAQQAAAAGSVDIIVSSADVMMQAVAKGNDLMILGTDITNNIYSLSASREVAQTVAGKSYPENMKALVDKRIGVTARGSSTEMVTRALFAGAGLSADKVAFVAVGAPTTAYAALVAKQVDAVLSWDPVPALCAATNNCKTFVDMSRGEGPAEMKAMNGGFVVWQARREYVQKNGPVIDRFLRAHAEAVRWVQDQANFEEAKALASRSFKLGDLPRRDEVFDQMVRSAIASYGTTFDRKAVDGFNAFLLSNKLIDKPLSAATIVYQNAP